LPDIIKLISKTITINEIEILTDNLTIITKILKEIISKKRIFSFNKR